MNPRNKYSEKAPNFEELSESEPTLKPYLFPSLRRDKRLTINWTDSNAVRELTRSLLHRDFGINWWIDDGFLCPAVTNRANYIHWLQDLLLLSPPWLNSISQKTKPHSIRGIDIGTGANCIYPLLGASICNWSFVGTDISDASLQLAAENVSRNPHIAYLIELRSAINSSKSKSEVVSTVSECEAETHCNCGTVFKTNDICNLEFKSNKEASTGNECRRNEFETVRKEVYSVESNGDEDKVINSEPLIPSLPCPNALNIDQKTESSFGFERLDPDNINNSNNNSNNNNSNCSNNNSTLCSLKRKANGSTEIPSFKVLKTNSENETEFDLDNLVTNRDLLETPTPNSATEFYSKTHLSTSNDQQNISTVNQNARISSDSKDEDRILSSTSADRDTEDFILVGVVREGETFEFCCCNPPFFESMDIAGQNPRTAFAGKKEEMVCNGGEKRFIMRMIDDSLFLREKIHWYTSMVGRKINLKILVSYLKKSNVPVIRTTQFIQGKTTRWGLAWSFKPILES